MDVEDDNNSTVSVEDADQPYELPAVHMEELVFLVSYVSDIVYKQ